MRTSLLLAATLVVGVGAPAFAADHADGPSATQNLTDLSGDITDLFAFSDANNVNLIMDVSTNATSMSKFSNAIQYVFHVDGVTGLTDTAPFQSTVICTFDATQKVSCWLQQGTTSVDYVTGDASPTAGLSSAAGKLKVFAGLRDDPFFFNIQGFRKVTSTVPAIAGSLKFTPGGCPLLDDPSSPASSATVRTLLSKQSDGSTAGVDDFAKGGKAAAPLGIATLTGNILALVVAIPKATLTNGGAKPILGVWASTHK